MTMSRRLGSYAVRFVMIVAGLVLALDIAYFARGSLEQFPTDEQVDKVRTVTAVIAAALLLAEVALWQLLRSLQRAPSSERVSE